MKRIITIFIIVTVILIAYLYYPSALIKELSRTAYESHTEITFKAKEEIDFSKCSIYQDKKELKYDRNKISASKIQVINITKNSMQIKGIISASEKKIIDLDKDRINDSIYICAKNNLCPESYDGNHIAIKLSSKGLQYIPLNADISKGSKKIDLDLSASKEFNYFLSIKGITSNIPYTIGLNNERIILYYSPIFIQDLNKDNEEEMILVSDKIYLIPSNKISYKLNEELSEKVYYHPDKKIEVSDNIYLNNKLIAKTKQEDNQLTILPETMNRGLFTIESIDNENKFRFQKNEIGIISLKDNKKIKIICKD